MAETAAASAPAEIRSWRWLAAPLLAFALFALTAGLLARHEPRSKGYFRLFFSDPVHLKAGFATAAAVLACFQLFSAAWIFRKLPWRKPAWVTAAQRGGGHSREREPYARREGLRAIGLRDVPHAQGRGSGRADRPEPGRAPAGVRSSASAGHEGRQRDAGLRREAQRRRDPRRGRV